MALTLIPIPKFIAQDANGDPYPGGKLYCYAAGTTTPQAVYTDVNGTVAHANPVILDGTGGETIYVSPTSYKFTLHDASDNLIWTVDNALAFSGFAASLDVTGTAGEALAAGEAVYLSDGAGGRTAGRWYLADADTAAYSSQAPLTGTCPVAIASGAAGSIRLQGKQDGYSSLTVGSNYYASATAGAITATTPTNARKIGIADTSTSILLDQTQRDRLVLAQGTITVDNPILDLSVTWNAAVTFTAIKLNVTDTSSNAGSLLADLQVGGSSKFSVDKDGDITGTTLALNAASSQVLWDADGNVGTMTWTPTTTRTMTFPDVTGTVAVLDATQTLTNKTVALGSNTVSGTQAQFDTACSDGTFLFVGDTIDLSTTTVTGTSAEFNTANSDDSFAFLGDIQTFSAAQTISDALTVTGIFTASGNGNHVLGGATGIAAIVGDQTTTLSTDATGAGHELVFYNADTSQVASQHIGSIAFKSIDTDNPNEVSGIAVRSTGTGGLHAMHFYSQPGAYVTGTTPDLSISNAGDLILQQGNLFFLDGASGAGGDSWMFMSGADVFDVVVGGVTMMRITEAATDFTEFFGSYLLAPALQLDQGAGDGEILSLKSSDVAHGMTLLTDTDTYAFFEKHTAASGGLGVEGYSESTVGVRVRGHITTEDTTKSTAAVAPIELEGFLKVGTTSGALSTTDANIATITNGGTARFIFDIEGSAHADIEWTTFDSHDDVALLDAFDRTMTVKDAVTNAFGEVLQYNRGDLMDARIVNFYDDGPRAMVNFTRLAMLHTGALRQLGREVRLLSGRLLALEGGEW